MSLSEIHFASRFDRLLSLLFRQLFLVQIVFLIAAGGSVQASRIPQLLWVLVALVIVMRWNKYELSGFSSHVKILASLVAGISTLGFAHGILYPNFPVDFEDLIRVYSVVMILLAADLHRSMGVSNFIYPMRHVAALVIILTVINLMFFRVEEWGRALFFGLHPNLGGASLLACIFVLVTTGFRTSTVVLISAAVYSIAEFQARGALIASLFIILGYVLLYFFRPGKNRNFRLFSALTIIVVLSLSAAAFEQQLRNLIDSVATGVFLVDDPTRGIGSGLSGRIGRYGTASALGGSPWIGVGIGNATFDRDEMATSHNGFQTVFAELGVLSSILLLLVAAAILRTGRSSIVQFASLIAFSGLFWLEPRSFNLSPFPMFFWILLLPFASELKYSPKRSAPN